MGDVAQLAAELLKKVGPKRRGFVAAKKEFEIGDEIKIVKAAGAEGKDRTGYVYFYSGNTDEIPVGSIGTIHAIRPSAIDIIIQFPRGSWHVHPSEIEHTNPRASLRLKSNLPLPPLVDMLANEPAIIFNDRLWVPAPEGADPNHHEFNLRVKSKTIPFEESADLAALERLYLMCNIDKIAKFKAEFLKETMNVTDIQREHGLDHNRTAILKLLFEEVFPRLRKNNTTHLKKVLGEGVGDTGDGTAAMSARISAKAMETRQKIMSQAKAQIEKKLKALEQERPDDISSKRKKKILELLSDDPNAAFDLFISRPKSLFGSTLLGANVLITSEGIFGLTEDRTANGISVSMGVKKYSLIELSDLISKLKLYIGQMENEIKISALKGADDNYLSTILSADEIALAMGKAEYSEEDFGFVEKDGQFYPYLWVPEHIVKFDRKFYRFSKVRVAARIWMEERRIVLENQARTIEPYNHMFASSTSGYGGICLGNYSYDSLQRMAKGAAIVKLLNDAKNTLMRGFYNMAGHSPMRHFSQLDNKRISAEDAKQLEKEGVNIFTVFGDCHGEHEY